MGGLHGKGGSDGMESMALNWEREAFMHLPGPEGAHRKLWGDFMEREAVIGWKEWL